MGSNLVIVAIPEEDDRVWKVSSEKIPHLTVLFLGESDEVSNVEEIVKYVEHAATQTLRRFYLPVDRRGELGADKADVLFFKKGRYDYKAVRDFRVALLKDSNIKSAYDASPQFEAPPEVGSPGNVWIPHMTLGYPATPAKPLDEQYGSKIYEVCFNKIAVWMGDFEGPEFLLKDQWDEWDECIPMDVAMSAIQHYGTKGMRWGVRKADVTSGAKAVGNATKSAGSGLARAAGGAARLGLDIQFENKAEDGRAATEISNKANSAFKRTDLPAIKARHGDYGKLRNRARHPLAPEAKAYRKDARETYIKRLEESANSLTNFSETRQYTIRERGWELPAEGGDLPKSQNFWDVSTRDIKHKIGDIFSTIEVLVDDEGWITEIKPVESDTSMAQSAINIELDLKMSELEHYGTKGMRWGVRRGDPTAVAPMARSRVPHGNKRQTKIKTEGGENHPAVDDAIKVAQHKAKLAKSGPAALTNRELQEVANRIELESRVKRAVQPAGRKFVSNLLRNQGENTAGFLLREEAKKRGLASTKK